MPSDMDLTKRCGRCGLPLKVGVHYPNSVGAPCPAAKVDIAAALAEQGEQRRELGRECMERQS